jgi:hypothetical protein
MTTLTVKFGEKEYRAAKLTITEFSQVTKAIDAMQVAGKEGNLCEVNRLLLSLGEIVCASICRAGSQITLDEIGSIAIPEQIISALGILMHLESVVSQQSAGTKVN